MHRFDQIIFGSLEPILSALPQMWLTTTDLKRQHCRRGIDQRIESTAKKLMNCQFAVTTVTIQRAERRTSKINFLEIQDNTWYNCMQVPCFVN